MNRIEQIIVKQLRDGQEEAYKYLFDHHYSVLCHIAAQYIHDDFLAETIVGDVIFHMWEIRDNLKIESSLRSYMVQSVRHSCLDYLKSQYVQREHIGVTRDISDLPMTHALEHEENPLGQLLENELEDIIAEAIERLPEDCRTVFKMSRFEGRKYQEIAKMLGITVNTVKYHLKHAMSLLRKDLKKYMKIAILLFIN